MAQSSPSRYPIQGSLRDLAKIVMSIRRARAFGCLTLRNTTQLGIVHLYFRAGRLVHVVSNRGATNKTLDYLREWTQATIRFERSVAMPSASVSADRDGLLDELLLDLQRRRVVLTPETSKVVEGGIIASTTGKQLLSPQEWQVLLEGIRRVSLAVAHIAGPREASNALHDILEDCATTFPAIASLHIAPGGYLQLENASQIDRIPREEVIEGFSALIHICQHFCASLIGDIDAHKLMLQALGDLCPEFLSMGAFTIDYKLLSRQGQ